MTLNPGVFKRAREEVDRVVGRDRLPEISDQPSLPYICAIVHEVLRWSPPVPAGPFACRRRLTITSELIRRCSSSSNNQRCIWGQIHPSRCYCIREFMVSRTFELVHLNQTLYQGPFYTTRNCLDQTPSLLTPIDSWAMVSWTARFNILIQHLDSGEGDVFPLTVFLATLLN